MEANLYDDPIINKIIDWIKSDRWLNYYELGRYIFVHAFIPLLSRYNNIYDSLGDYNSFMYSPTWRENATEMMWEVSRWGAPFELYKKGFFNEELEKGKILVCGHWNTSDFYNHLLYENDIEHQLDMKDNPIFISDKYKGLIGIDACTALSRKVNVLIIEEKDL